MIENAILGNRTFSAADKFILAFLRSYEKAGRFFFGTTQYMSGMLGIDQAYLEQRIKALIEVGVITQTREEIRTLLDLEDLKKFQINKVRQAEIKKALEGALN